MKSLLLTGSCITLLCCSQTNPVSHPTSSTEPPHVVQAEKPGEGSWAYYLQRLPAAKGIVVDYRGRPVPDQHKAAAILPFDVGNRDLQQCADALMRLRAEYLFSEKRYDDISFRFTSGQWFAFREFLAGTRPVLQGSRLKFVNGGKTTAAAHAALRSYLDIVYTYAGTLSLAQQLQPVQKISIGTVILKPGSPGHCCMVVDAAVNAKGQRVFKLAEGYMPAQSIYILKNEEDGSCWYPIVEGRPIETASYYFDRYRLYSFE